MLRHSLALPHLKQDRKWICIPACVRMVLAYYGESRTEAELCGLLRCTAAGTKAANVRLVSALGYDVDVNYLGVEHAREHLAHGTPIIACVRTGDLE